MINCRNFVVFENFFFSIVDFFFILFGILRVLLIFRVVWGFIEFWGFVIDWVRDVVVLGDNWFGNVVGFWSVGVLWGVLYLRWWMVFLGECSFLL